MSSRLYFQQPVSQPGDAPELGVGGGKVRPAPGASLGWCHWWFAWLDAPPEAELHRQMMAACCQRAHRLFFFSSLPTFKEPHMVSFSQGLILQKAGKL